MVNKVILIGNVGMDPEVRALEGGAKVARLRIATTERIYNRQTQTATEHTEWHTVTLWRGLADVADRYVRVLPPLRLRKRRREPLSRSAAEALRKRRPTRWTTCPFDFS